jgi:hypothetical protein
MPDQKQAFEIALGEDNVLRARFLHDPDITTLRQLLEAVQAYGNPPRRLLDCRGITLDFNLQEQDEISTVIRSQPIYGHRTAFLVDNVMSFARLRQFMSYREDKEIERQVFRDEVDALNWLLDTESDSRE